MHVVTNGIEGASRFSLVNGLSHSETIDDVLLLFEEAIAKAKYLRGDSG